MTLSIQHTPGAVERFLETDWPHEQTFVTPKRESLKSFVSAIVANIDLFQTGIVIFKQVIFEPDELHWFLGRHGRAVIMQDTYWLDDWSIQSDARNEIEELLEAVFSETIDFAFVVQPDAFKIFTDHDGYTTFFSANESMITCLTKSFSELGVKHVEGWKRQHWPPVL
jgi:hypothetical protein